MVSLRRTLPFLALLLSAGCSSSAPGPSSSSADSIQGGSSDVGDPAVGLIEFVNDSFCTGALIAPDLVLTAGHCTEAAPSGFFLGIDKAHATRYDIVGVAPFPGYTATETCPNPTIDVALMKLAAPIPDVPPLALAHEIPTVGESCRAIGFGRHNTSTATEGDVTQVEQKRDAFEVVTQLGPTSIEVTLGTGIADHGDSGGPLLCGGVIAAAVSCHVDGDYPTHVNEYYARIDGIEDWITAMESSFDPSAPWPPVADGGVDDGGVTDDGGTSQDAGADASIP